MNMKKVIINLQILVLAMTIFCTTAIGQTMRKDSMSGTEKYDRNGRITGNDSNGKYGRGGTMETDTMRKGGKMNSDRMGRNGRMEGDTTGKRGGMKYGGMNKKGKMKKDPMKKGSKMKRDSTK